MSNVHVTSVLGPQPPFIDQLAMIWMIVLPVAAVFALMWYHGVSKNQTVFGWSIVFLIVLGVASVISDVILNRKGGVPASA